ncbi:MAG: hypothetical protein ACI4NM_03690 [Bullifex sp.]
MAKKDEKVINFIGTEQGSEEVELLLSEIRSMRNQMDDLKEKIASAEHNLLESIKIGQDGPSIADNLSPELYFETLNMKFTVTREKTYSVTAEDKPNINSFIQDDYANNWPKVLKYYNIDFKPSSALKKASRQKLEEIEDDDVRWFLDFLTIKTSKPKIDIKSKI